MSSANLVVGTEFKSFDDLCQFLEKYEIAEKQVFSRKNSHKLKACSSEGMEKALVYDYLLYTCRRGGVYIPKGKKLRQTSSMKTECPAKIVLTADSTKRKLIVRQIISEHNHEPLEADGAMKRAAQAPHHSLKRKKDACQEMPSIEPEDIDYLQDPSAGDMPESAIKGAEIRDDLLRKLLQILRAASGTQLTCMISALKTMVHHFQEGNNVIVSAAITDILEFPSVSANPMEKTTAVETRGVDKPLPTTQTEIIALSPPPAANLMEKTCPVELLNVGEMSATTEMKDMELCSSAAVIREKSKKKTAIVETRFVEESRMMTRRKVNESSLSTSIEAKKKVSDIEQLTVKLSQVKESSDIVPDPNADNLNDIHLMKIKGRGRPKGKALKAIGLPVAVVPTPFADRPKSQKVREMLSWLVEGSVVQNILDKESLVKSADIDLNPANLRDSFVDESVNLQSIKKYFEAGVFNLFTDSILEKKEKGLFTCGACSAKLNTKRVLCGSCLLWFDFSCASVKRARKIWYCSKCNNGPMIQQGDSTAYLHLSQNRTWRKSISKYRNISKKLKPHRSPLRAQDGENDPPGQLDSVSASKLQ